MLARNSASYLSETEPAIRHLFDAIGYYEGLLVGVTPPSQATTADELAKYMRLAEESFDYSFSEATLCGSILQVAFMGIFLFSKSSTIPPHCSDLVKQENEKAIRFCVGRLVRGIPIGLIVYAGRNQFNHWDDKAFDVPTTAVFQALLRAHSNNPIFDMAYELNYPERTIKAKHLVLNELRWRTYDEYAADIRELICV